MNWARRALAVCLVVFAPGWAPYQAAAQILDAAVESQAAAAVRTPSPAAVSAVPAALSATAYPGAASALAAPAAEPSAALAAPVAAAAPIAAASPEAAQSAAAQAVPAARPAASSSESLESAGAEGRVIFDRAARASSLGESPVFEGAPPSSALTERPSPAERKVLDKIIKDLGPVVEASSAPTLYAAIQTTFERLSAAQLKLFATGTVAVNRVRLIDSPVVNAFVYPLRTPGVRRSNNMVFVTTGLLKKMLDADPAKIGEGMTRVAGVLAHELAHPLDDVDAQGVLTNYGRALGGQEREIRADSEGAMIAKEAGYPASAVHDSLQRLFEGESGRDGALAAMAATHPQNDLRLVMQRMLLTLDRYDRGVHVPRYPEEIPASALAELDRIDEGARLGRFAPPKDLSEALARMKQVSQLKRGEEDKKLEFNRLLLWVDANLSRRTRPLDDAEMRVFFEIAACVARPDSPELFGREERARFFAVGSHSEEFRAYPSHSAFMKKIPAYRDPRYVGWLQENFLANKSESYGKLQSALQALVKIVPADELFSAFGERIAEELPAAVRSHPNRRYVYENNLARGLSAELQIRLALLFHRRVLPRLTEAERAAFFLDQLQDYSYVIPQLPYSRPKNSGDGIVVRRALFLNDPRLKELQGEYRDLLRAVWENRGYYGVLDLLSPFSRIDWNAIFTVLDIDPQAGRGQLRQAVKAFVRSPGYVALLKAIRDSDSDSFRMMKVGGAFGKKFDWLDDTLGASFGGEGNDALVGDPELRAFGRKVLARAYYASRPELYRRKYRAMLAAALAGNAAPSDVAELGRIHRELAVQLAGSERSVTPLADVQAEAIAGSPLSAAVKRELLQAVFLEGYGPSQRVEGLTNEDAGGWLFDRDRAKTVARALIGAGLARDDQDLLSRLLSREDFLRRVRKDGFAGYAGAVGALKGDLLSGLETALSRAATDGEKAALLTDFLATTVDPADGDYANPEFVNIPELRGLKERVAALAAPLDLTFAQSLSIFRRLTGSGAAPATDAFFRARLEPVFDEAAASAAGLSLPQILESSRISSSELQLSLARRALEPEIARLGTSAPAPADLGRLIETLNAYVRHGSLNKDEFLESLAWRLNLSGPELGAFIEDEKSYNWRKANPLLLRFGSGLSAQIGRLSRRGRAEFVRFLIRPEGGRLPDEIYREIERNVYEEAVTVNSAKDYPESPAKVRADADRAAELLKLEIEAGLIDASAFERIPLYELLLSAGPEALSRSADYPYDVMREFLGYEKGSTQESMLAAFLAVVPEHERTVSLAYMLSQAGENKSSVKNLFEVFQTVGVKFGQLSSTWKLFGDEISRQTSALKNDARPMTKAEILETARRELSPEEFSRIKRLVKVVGSASIKTVVLVELQDGRQVVMMLRRPHAAEQIESNLRLGSAFLKELDRRGLSASSALFETVLDAVRRQLAGELRLTREADSLRAAKLHYERLNRSMRAELGPWRFRVPQPVAGFRERDTILFVEKAEGETYDRLSPDVRAEVGPLIADSSLNMLFRDGWFDADRHTGNQLIDERARTIYPLDFGQAVEFSRAAFWRGDDRYELAQFLRALSAGDADGVLRRGLALSDRAPRDRDALRAKIRATLSGDGVLQDKIVALVGAFAEQDAPLDGRFTFGAFKGLMTLAAENYLPDASFRAALGREISALLRRKFPLALLDGRG
ncbi:MAG: hypothetical protein HKL90_10905 [Elusimicrobia bacterium]|nr:hypothetical protein [Elusimicrobiota bacterium]